jgi:hypothetical protein
LDVGGKLFFIDNCHKWGEAGKLEIRKSMRSVKVDRALRKVEVSYVMSKCLTVILKASG